MMHGGGSNTDRSSRVDVDEAFRKMPDDWIIVRVGDPGNEFFSKRLELFLHILAIPDDLLDEALDGNAMIT